MLTIGTTSQDLAVTGWEIGEGRRKFQAFTTPKVLKFRHKRIASSSKSLLVIFL